MLRWKKCAVAQFSGSPVFKGVMVLFLKIIILCIWCNRICWHALMFKKHIICQILYNNVKYNTIYQILYNNVGPL